MQLLPNIYIYIFIYIYIYKYIDIYLKKKKNPADSMHIQRQWHHTELLKPKITVKISFFFSGEALKRASLDTIRRVCSTYKHAGAHTPVGNFLPLFRTRKEKETKIRGIGKAIRSPSARYYPLECKPQYVRVTRLIIIRFFF